MRKTKKKTTNTIPQRPFPSSSYRLQLGIDFQFDNAVELVAYLRELGISHAYLSPIFRSGSQSTHGYDVCSFQEIDPKLGGEAGFQHFAGQAEENGLGLILDFVPNHMRADIPNGWWCDVLEKGRQSRYAKFFDIDWNAPRPGHPTNRVENSTPVLLPCLEAPYSDVLENGKLQLVYEQNGFWIRYYEHRFPASPKTYQIVLSELMSAKSMAHWRESADQVLHNGANLHQLKEYLRTHLTNESFCTAFASSLGALNGKAGEPESLDKLDDILQSQNFRLCWWRIASQEINYRRFFDVNELACLNMQFPEVFKASHQLLRKLIRGKLHVGVRVDHPDGLWDPKEYFERLGDLWHGCANPPFVVAEKILTGEERLPANWPVAGTTGYEFLNHLNGVFIQSDNEEQFSQAYQRFTGSQQNFEQVLFASRKKVLHASFEASLRLVVGLLAELAACTRYGRDFTETELREALSQFVSAFPIYRTYVTETSIHPSQQDRRAIDETISYLKRTFSVNDAPLAFIGRLILGDFPHDFDDKERRLSVHFAMKLQQLTAPLAAKGREDTACYIYNRLVSLNEVGGDPAEFGISVSRFHQLNHERLQSWPHSMVATSTHDTKRSEDVRARINVLSEMPNEWEEAVGRWKELNKGFKSTEGGQSIPSPNDEWLLYQTLVATWPSSTEGGSPNVEAFCSRIVAYMRKAVREAKERTTWIDPDQAYENGLQKFVETILRRSSENSFLPDIEGFQQRISFFGYLNSLSQTLLKITSPGVPDFYQGTELWDFSLVDPDNRRPVDYVKRKGLLAELRDEAAQKPRLQLAQELLALPCDKLKLYVTWQGLQARQEREELFAEGEYVPVASVGRCSQHLCAFLRRHQNSEALVIAPRLSCTLMKGVERIPLGQEVWSDTYLSWPGAQPGKLFRDRFTDAVVTVDKCGDQIGLRAAEALSSFPIALLESIDS